MKTKAFLLSFLLVIPLATASVNITSWINTTGDVNFDTTIITNGSVNVTIDGTNIPNEFEKTWNYIHSHEEIWTKHRNLDWLVRHITSAINWILGQEEPNDWDKEIGYQLTRAFVTRYEYEQLLLQNQYLEWRIEALEKAMDSVAQEAYCKAKIDMMFKYNFTSVECGNTTYHRVNPEDFVGYSVVGIEPL